ncbi:ArnT family glycosyltransferase [Microseira sp. BLCC-F43]|uniref:ArnT family glycosyltransferase n=1 Tax=Microseira sp. BLCC-F43 TaxID=3153602 RepID=UPI0035B784CB
MNQERIENNFIKILQLLYGYRYKVAILMILIACYLVFFWRLGEGPIRQWDESSLAVNALEMTLNGDWIVKYLDGKPDLINTKPNLAIWLIAGCMKFFGYNEFALRLPSAISALITVIIIYIFGIKYLQDFKAALMGCFVLITSIGFTGEHVARNGDYDALLVLWITIYSLAYFMYLHSAEKNKNFYATVITFALVLAVWTKGIAGILAVPGLLIYAAWQKQVRKLLLSPQVYYSAIIFMVLTIGYYLVRESYKPGFLSAVMVNEITGRYGDIVPGGTPRGFSYYLVNILSYRFVPWIYLFPFCLAIASLSEDKAAQKFSLFSFIYLGTYFLIISYAKSKFNWYDAPLYPIAALTTGLGVSMVVKLVADYCYKSWFKFKKYDDLIKRQLAYMLLIISIFILPFLNNVILEITINRVPFRENDAAISFLALDYSKYFKQLAITRIDVKNNKLLVVNSISYNLPLLFYTQVANLNSQYPLEVKWEEPSAQVFRAGEVIVNCDSNTQGELNRKYVMRVLHSEKYCGTFLIENYKNSIKSKPSPKSELS